MVYGQDARRRLGKGAEWSDAEPSLKAGWANVATGADVSWDQAMECGPRGLGTPDAIRGG
jgi:hypothetical protein